MARRTGAKRKPDLRGVAHGSKGRLSKRLPRNRVQAREENKWLRRTRLQYPFLKLPVKMPRGRTVRRNVAGNSYRIRGRKGFKRGKGPSRI